MGICCSCYSNVDMSPSATVKLILLNGQLLEFMNPIKVDLLLPPSERGSHKISFICNSDEMEFDEYVSAMSGEEQLQRGGLYFELPSGWLTRRLEAEDMASLAVKATAALAQNARCGVIRCGCWIKRIDLFEFFRPREISENFGGDKELGKLMRALSVITEE